MLNTQVDDYQAMRGETCVCRIMSGSLGFLICVLIGISGVEARVPEFLQKKTDSLGNRVLVTRSRENDESRRDPFRPLNQARSIFSSSKKSRPEPQKNFPIQETKAPKFTLLGIIHGLSGPQAVIQVSPGKRIFAKPGVELAQSGWFIKTISKGEVLLEHRSHSSSRESLPKVDPFILSFPILGQSQ